MYVNEEFVLQMMKAGASGYLIKNVDSGDLIRAINIVMKKDVFYCPSISEGAMQAYMETARHQEEKELTRRERQVLELIGRGISSREIAERLFISVKTVRNHRANIMEKLDIHNVVSLVRYGAQRKMVDLFFSE
jgi:DNA-binding NarL/FixJ family response regulator